MGRVPGMGGRARPMIQNVIQAVLVAAILGAYGFAWQINSRITALENTSDEQHTRAHAVIDCKLGIAPECASNSSDTD